MRKAMREIGERQIDLEGEAIAYRLIRSRRQSIGIEIAYGGAVVRAPHWARVGDIHAFMLDNSKWIRTKLHTWRAARSLIRLQWRLIQLSSDLADYIIAHEVSHLREMNHSPQFWTTVESLYPAHREAERRLRHLAPLIEP